MKIIETEIKVVICFEPEIYGDERGFFMETYRKSWIKDLGIDTDFVQDNHSSSRKGILRGLHYQIKNPQGKLVRVVHGEVFDVAVDLRKSSPTFGKWVGMTLSTENKRIMWVPPGFAHGFLVTSNSAEFVYKCTSYYTPEYERSLLWNDPIIAVNWPSEVTEEFTLSEKDRNAPTLNDIEIYQDL